MARELLKTPDELRSLYPLLWASYSPASKVSGLDVSREEGGDTGDPLIPIVICVTMQPHLVWADKEMAKVGGFARAIMDDVYVGGPIEKAMEVAVALGKRLLEACNQKQRPDKSKVLGRDAAGIRAFLEAEDSFKEFQLGCLKSCVHTDVSWGEGIGLVVSGCPIGDDEFVSQSLAKGVTKMVAKIDKIASQLQNWSTQGLFAVAASCLQPLAQHLMQVLPPTVTQFHIDRLDLALSKVCVITTGIIPNPADEITTMRFSLPRRLFGSGIRKQAGVAAAAYVGGLLRALPFMLDHTREDGTVRSGFMNSLIALLGATSFNAGNERTRFEHLTISGDPLGDSFAGAWADLKSRAARVLPTDGLLASPVEAAGLLPDGSVVTKGAQHLLTKEVDDATFETLETLIKTLPNEDRRKIAFIHVDKLSSAFVGSIPTPEDLIGISDLTSAWQTYFGLPQSLVAPYIGRRVFRSKALMDPYGTVLANAMMVGDGWRQRHDSIKWLVHSLLVAAQVRFSTEVFGLFAASLDQTATNGLEAKAKQGMVPDFKIAFVGKPDTLMELKIIGHVDAHFTKTTSKERCGGVEHRASSVHKEYVNKAIAADRKYNRHVSINGSKGKMQTTLESFPKVRGLVVGPRGEGSADLHYLLREIAGEWAGKSWQAMGAPSVVVAKGVVMARVYRLVGISAVRAQAALLRERLGIYLSAGGDNAARGETDARRCAGMEQARAARRDYADWWGCGARQVR